MASRGRASPSPRLHLTVGLKGCSHLGSVLQLLGQKAVWLRSPVLLIQRGKCRLNLSNWPKVTQLEGISHLLARVCSLPRSQAALVTG